MSRYVEIQIDNRPVVVKFRVIPNDIEIMQVSDNTYPLPEIKRRVYEVFIR